jgi:hypothetical protein
LSVFLSYGSLLDPGKIALETLCGQDFLFGHRETDTVITMPAFVPQRISPPYHFDIKRNRQGYWIARDRLAGGTFLTCKDAVRFALFETGGDSAHVHTAPEPEAARIDGARARRRPRRLS